MGVKFDKSGVVTSGGFSDTSPTQDMKTKVLDDGSVWARIHWIDVTNTVEWFANNDEVLECTNKSNRYSRLGIVDEFKTSDGIYEFMLTYPRLSSTLYNRWKQSSSPHSTTGTVTEIVTLAWNHYYGALRSTGSYEWAVFKCDSGTTWFAAIGQMKAWTSTQYIPAADGSSQTETELWVRIDNLPRQTQMKIYDNFITTNEFIEV